MTRNARCGFDRGCGCPSATSTYLDRERAHARKTEIWNSGGGELIDAEILRDLPTAPENTRTMLVVDNDFWADHKEEYQEIYQAWSAK